MMYEVNLLFFHQFRAEIPFGPEIDSKSSGRYLRFWAGAGKINPQISLNNLVQSQIIQLKHHSHPKLNVLSWMHNNKLIQR